MRIPSNSLTDLIAFYHSELGTIYESSEIEAILNLVLVHYLSLSKRDLLLKKQQNINQSDLLKLYFCCKDLKNNIPVQYVLKEAWFYNLKFYVDGNVLIPRPETEELVDIIVKENKNAFSVLDIGTGSGCIPVTIKNINKSANVYACDISKETLTVAKKNAELQKTDINFIELNILNNEETRNKLSVAFDVIVSNPPYIKDDEKKIMTTSVLAHEPHLALFVEGSDEIIFYKKIIDLCKEKLNSDGKLYFELNPLTATSVLNYAKESNLFNAIELIKDMSGKMRFLRGVKKIS